MSWDWIPEGPRFEGEAYLREFSPQPARVGVRTFAWPLGFYGKFIVAVTTGSLPSSAWLGQPAAVPTQPWTGEDARVCVATRVPSLRDSTLFHSCFPALTCRAFTCRRFAAGAPVWAAQMEHGSTNHAGGGQSGCSFFAVFKKKGNLGYMSQTGSAVFNILSGSAPLQFDADRRQLPRRSRCVPTSSACG
jgi:hypothetical protein